MQIEQHLLFEFVLSVVDIDGIVVSVEVVDERLNGWLAQVTQVRRRLTRRRA